MKTEELNSKVVMLDVHDVFAVLQTVSRQCNDTTYITCMLTHALMVHVAMTSPNSNQYACQVAEQGRHMREAHMEIWNAVAVIKNAVPK